METQRQNRTSNYKKSSRNFKGKNNRNPNNKKNNRFGQSSNYRRRNSNTSGTWNISEERGKRTPLKPKKQNFWQKILAVILPSSQKNASTRNNKFKNGNHFNNSGVEKKRLVSSHPKLFVGNLSYEVDEADLNELFQGVGSVKTAEIVYNRRTQRSMGYAFVEMQSANEAQRAIDNLHEKNFHGRKLIVNSAKNS